MKKTFVIAILFFLATLLIGVLGFGGCYYLFAYYVEMTPEQKLEADQAMEETFSIYQDILEKYPVQYIETSENYVVVPDYHPKHDAEILEGKIKCELLDGIRFEIRIAVFFNKEQELMVKQEEFYIRNVASTISEVTVDFKKIALIDELLQFFGDNSESLSSLLLQYQSEIIEGWENGEYEDRNTYASITCNNYPDIVSVIVRTTMEYHYAEETYKIFFSVKN